MLENEFDNGCRLSTPHLIVSQLATSMGCKSRRRGKMTFGWLHWANLTEIVLDARPGPKNFHCQVTYLNGLIQKLCWSGLSVEWDTRPRCPCWKTRTWDKNAFWNWWAHQNFRLTTMTSLPSSERSFHKIDEIQSMFDYLGINSWEVPFSFTWKSFMRLCIVAHFCLEYVVHHKMLLERFVSTASYNAGNISMKLSVALLK